MANFDEAKLRELLASRDFQVENYDDLSMEELIVLKNAASNMIENNYDEKVIAFFTQREDFFLHMILRSIPKLSEMFCLYHSATKLPLIEHDDFEGSDMGFIYLDEQKARNAAAAEKKENNREILVAKIPGDQFIQFFSMLFTIGIDSLVINRGGAEVSFEINKIMKVPDYESMPPEKRPVFNQDLMAKAMIVAQLKAIPENVRSSKQSEDLEYYEGEMISSLMECQRIIVPIEVPDVEPGTKIDMKDIRIPYIMMDNEKYQPVCTDGTEYAKFKRDSDIKNMIVNGAALKQLIGKDIKGFMINPASIAVKVSKDNL